MLVLDFAWKDHRLTDDPPIVAGLPARGTAMVNEEFSFTISASSRLGKNQRISIVIKVTDQSNRVLEEIESDVIKFYTVRTAQLQVLYFVTL
jgi:hypothetical protein